MKKKVLIAVCALALVVVVAIGGTVAWLTDKTDEVKNTFTYGDIDIELVETTTEYKMVPGNTIEKDPTVTVKADSEKCWLFVNVDKSANFDDFMTCNIADGWTVLEGVEGVYYRAVERNASEQAFGIIADDKVTVKDSVTKEMLNALDETAGSETYPTLTFTAYAVQQSVTNNTTRTASEAWELVNK